ncbi:MAG: hypothetical protein KC505_02680 [Myxococcales bacterium]|nr:hypothetical protein [Myxococcales bacterium]USN50270.1 MAG: hypothetical protein H6731_08355 [Myxococcales bacterium]
MFAFFKRQWFFYAYTALITPSYLLPWLGSNSMFANIFSSVARWGFGVHVTSLCLAALLSFIRGVQLRTPQLALLSLSALVCDLVPLLNWIPLLPTFFHGLAILLGTDTKINISSSRLRW